MTGNYICTMFGSKTIPEEENIAYFWHTVTDKKYTQDSDV